MMNYGQQRISKIYNYDLFDPVATEGLFDIPILERVMAKPQRLIPFHQAIRFRGDKSNVGVHFFLDDYQFERIWNKPKKYLDLLQGFQCVCTPDWSMYLDMPAANLLWNQYRKQLIGQFFQKNGLKVVPTMGWGFQNSFQFCFQGVPKNATLAIPYRGLNLPVYQKIWKDGMKEILEKLSPQRILLYSESKPDFAWNNLEVVLFQPEHLQRVRKIRKGKIEVGERTKWLMENPGVIGAVAKNLGIQYDDWEDLRQEVMLQSLRCKDGFEKSKAGIQTWAWNFVRMVARKFQKNVMQKNSREVLWDDVRNALKNKD